MRPSVFITYHCKAKAIVKSTRLLRTSHAAKSGIEAHPRPSTLDSIKRGVTTTPCPQTLPPLPLPPLGPSSLTASNRTAVCPKTSTLGFVSRLLSPLSNFSPPRLILLPACLCWLVAPSQPLLFGSPQPQPQPHSHPHFHFR